MISKFDVLYLQNHNTKIIILGLYTKIISIMKFARNTYQKTSHKTRHTRDTLPKEGMEEMRALTESLMPSHWDIARRGRRARRARMALSPLTPAFRITILTMEIWRKGIYYSGNLKRGF